MTCINHTISENISKETTPSVSVEDAAYFAGLFDGEGTIAVDLKEGKRGGTCQLSLAIWMTDKNITARMNNIFGGCLTKWKIPKNGKRFGRACKLTNDEAINFLKQVYPYLGTKKRQAALAFKIRRIMLQSLRKHDLKRHSILKSLKYEIMELNQGREARVETVKVALDEAQEMIQSDLPNSNLMLAFGC